MTNTYRALSPAARAAFDDGVFDREFTPAEEQDWLASGLLELVPRTYRVLSNNYAAAKQGETFEGALLKENEGALISGGHIERVDPPRPTEAVKAATKKKED
jgi:hypothetical protein